MQNLIPQNNADLTPRYRFYLAVYFVNYMFACCAQGPGEVIFENSRALTKARNIIIFVFSLIYSQKCAMYALNNHTISCVSICFFNDKKKKTFKVCFTIIKKTFTLDFRVYSFY